MKFYLDRLNEITIEDCNEDLSNLLIINNGKSIDYHIDNGIIYFNDYLYEGDEFYISLNSLRYEIYPRFIYHSSEFDKLYVPDDLSEFGSRYSILYTSFKLFAPYCLKAYVVVDKTKYEMKYMGKGIYVAIVHGDLEGKTYVYNTIRRDKDYTFNDPFSYSSTLNTKESIIINPNKINRNHVSVSYDINPCKNVIYETSVRDFSSYNWPGKYSKKFLAFKEDGLTNKGYPIGVDYLKWLGITHVQLMPVLDFGSVDEEKEDGYNWGYDPVAYNLTEGSYIYDKNNPYARYNEFIELTNSLHSKNIKVILDLIFNHVYKVDRFNLANMIPYYFFRYNHDGSYANGSYCGNELRSESKFMREYLILMCRRYIELLDVDGFRFDLMGLIDVDTINAIKEMAVSIKPHFIMYGEGWNMGDALVYEKRSCLSNAHKVRGTGFFNPFFRDVMKGENDDYRIKECGYAFGNLSNLDEVRNCLSGSSNHDLQLSQSINYVECHDNHTFFDKASMALDDTLEKKKEVSRFALDLILVSRGIPFIHSGQEFFRTKNNIDNTYNLGDDINKLDWDRYVENINDVKHVRDLINIRKKYNQLTDPNSFVWFDSYYELLLMNVEDLKIIINPINYDMFYDFDNEVEVIFDGDKECSKKTTNLKILPHRLVIVRKLRNEKAD